jgi:hypothetical protein
VRIRFENMYDLFRWAAVLVWRSEIDISVQRLVIIKFWGGFPQSLLPSAEIVNIS